MANLKVLLLLFLAVSVHFCLCLGDDVVEQAKEGAQAAQEKTESWAGWAYEKVKNLGMKEDEKDQIVQNVRLQAENVGEKMTEAQEKALEAKNKKDDAVQRERSAANQAENQASLVDEKRINSIQSETKQKLKEALDEVKMKTANAYDEAKQNMNKASNVAAETYGEAKHKVGEAYESTLNEKATQGAKAHSEAAMAKAEKAKTS